MTTAEEEGGGGCAEGVVSTSCVVVGESLKRELADRSPLANLAQLKRRILPLSSTSGSDCKTLFASSTVLNVIQLKSAEYLQLRRKTRHTETL